MNSKLIASTVIAIAALSGASAFAQTSTIVYGESGYTPVTTFTSQISHAQVQADYLQARKDGSLPVYSESGFAAVKATPSQSSRAEVHADALQWVKTHANESVSN